MDKRKEMALKVGVLVKEIADGNEAALDKLLDVTGKWLNTWAKYYLVDKSYSDDVLSAVYAKVVDEAAKYKEKNAWNWMIKITKNTALNLNRSISALNQREVALVDNMANKNWENEALDRLFVESAIKQLNPLERKCIYLRFWRNATIEELSHTLKMPVSTVQYRLDKILLKLRGILKDEEK